MKIVTVQFNYPSSAKRPDYKKLLDVFRESVLTYMPEMQEIIIDSDNIPWKQINNSENAFVIFRTKAPVNNTGRPLNFNYNDFKLHIWVNCLENINDNIIFADCDMMMTQSAKHAFNYPFDIAATWRTTTNRIPMNGGIMMTRPTDAAKRFFREMYQTNRRMLKNIPFHRKWRIKYAGMNQSAFGYTYEKGKHGARIHRYFTKEWNAVDCDWHILPDNVVFIHYKSKLRKLVLANLPPSGKHKKAMKLWYAMKDKRKKRLKEKKQQEAEKIA